jgi:hypothetical protein
MFGRKTVIGLICLLLVAMTAATSDARGRRFRRRSRVSYTNYNTNYGYTFDGETVQEIAQQKANLLAQKGYGFHPGGYVGNYEGWGMGATREQAMWSTCNGGNCLSARGRAQAWSERAGCWFAINIW